MQTTTLRGTSHLTLALDGWQSVRSRDGVHLIGVLPGEGIGPDGTRAALEVLDAIRDASPHRFEVREGGPIGLEAERSTGSVLPVEVVRFCDEIFADGGALLCGPGGGRFVYELRAKFDLYCKFTPLRPLAALSDAGVLRPRAVENVDIVVVRENVGGLYFGESGERSNGSRLIEAHQTIRYDDAQVERILRVAMKLAYHRSGRLGVVVKPGGVPAISELWKQRTQDLNIDFGLEIEILEVDNACYQIVANAARFDVVVAPNMFGDVIGDTAALLLGSRGVSHSANFGDRGLAAYQTGHGAAYDLIGSDRADPIGQIRSLAMMLHESFGLSDVGEAIERAIERVVSKGWRTVDIMAPGCKPVGTREMARRIADATRVELGTASSVRAIDACAKSA